MPTFKAVRFDLRANPFLPLSREVLVFFRCFQSYIETPSDMMDQTKITYLAPPSTMGFIQTICTILDGLLFDSDKQIISLYGSTELQ